MNTEEHLIAGAKAGDSKACDELLSLHEEALRQFVRQHAGVAADVDDLLQQTELQAWRRVGTFNSGFCSGDARRTKLDRLGEGKNDGSTIEC